MSPIRYLARGYSKLAEFSGTACRPEFWWLFAANTGLLILSVQLTFIFPPSATAPLLCLGLCIFLFGNLSAAIRRLRDAKRSPFWLIALPVLPFILSEAGQTDAEHPKQDQEAIEEEPKIEKIAA